ncbi:MAG: GGDEF domain-containing protein [Marinobacter sp.]|uniref:GGDEF domain-containing protein n=1 Tax=Marinobacter sp. TaxID=50741 RepID=UPI00299E5373|nr:GGDEF domain-containing protein [Marinobacter sp.]MDX1756285.1 GGDEF domain-containing protein [Marinobacter sp.]
MKPPQSSVTHDSLGHSHAGLRDRQRRSLLRLLYGVSAATLLGFAGLQFFNHNPWLATGEIVAALTLLAGCVRLGRARSLRAWIYGLLIPLFAFFNLIILWPNASMAAFAWVLMMPVLAYQLLGQREGLRLSMPFMVAGCASYGWFLGTVESVGEGIDLLNMVLCAGLMLAFVHLYEQRREEAERRMLALARTDAVTGLANRDRFREALVRTIAECQRSNSAYALVLVTVDALQQVRREFGREVADEVAQQVSRCLTERLRITDEIGRLGEDRFGLILRDVSSDAADRLMAGLAGRIAERDLHAPHDAPRISASYGIAHSSRDGHQVDALFRTAERRCEVSGSGQAVPAPAQAPRQCRPATVDSD